VLVPTADSWPEGRASIDAVSLAIDAANAHGLLGPMIRGSKITYRWKEVGCDRSKALAALSQILEEGPVDAVIGPGCNAACESTAILTSARDVPQISYSCSSAALSDKTAYPTVRLTCVPRVRITVHYARNSAVSSRTIWFGSLFARHRAIQAGSQRF
jgi:ABC-type branched-subunit amino acid transport system substrate-binding protein